MMTSSNGSIFRVTGHLCWEFTGQVTGEIPAQRPVTQSFDVFFDGDLRYYRAHYDVTVMKSMQRLSIDVPFAKEDWHYIYPTKCGDLHTYMVNGLQTTSNMYTYSYSPAYTFQCCTLLLYLPVPLQTYISCNHSSMPYFQWRYNKIAAEVKHGWVLRSSRFYIDVITYPCPKLNAGLAYLYK